MGDKEMIVHEVGFVDEIGGVADDREGAQESINQGIEYQRKNNPGGSPVNNSDTDGIKSTNHRKGVSYYGY